MMKLKIAFSQVLLIISETRWKVNMSLLTDFKLKAGNHLATTVSLMKVLTSGAKIFSAPETSSFYLCILGDQEIADT